MKNKETNRLKLLIDYLTKQYDLSQKQLAQFAEIPESTLSTKSKSATLSAEHDGTLSKLQQKFYVRYLAEQDSFEVLAEKVEENDKAIKHFKHGKLVDYLETKWFVYIYFDDVSQQSHGIGRAVLHIRDKFDVELSNLPTTDNRLRNYKGSIELDKSEQFILINMVDGVTKEKFLHIKGHIGLGTAPSLFLGHYSNIGERYALYAESVIFERIPKEEEENMATPDVFKKSDKEKYEENVKSCIRRFLFDKRLNVLTTTRTTIKNEKDLQEWFDNIDLRNNAAIKNPKITALMHGGDELDYQIFHLHHNSSALNSYKLKLYKEHHKILANLYEDEEWLAGEVTNYNNQFSIVFEKKENKIIKKLFMIFTSPMVIKEKSLFPGIVTGITNDGVGLTSFGVVLCKCEDSNLTQEQEERIREKLRPLANSAEASITISRPTFD